jgi:hypothetical protein
LLQWKEPGVIVAGAEGRAKQSLNFEEDGIEKAYVPRSGTPPPPPSAREVKRPKKVSTPKKDKNVNEQAASVPEDRRAK